MSKKVLTLTGDAVEALEAYYPYYRSLEEGFEVTIASPTDAKVLHTVVHDFERLADLHRENAGISSKPMRPLTRLIRAGTMP